MAEPALEAQVARLTAIEDIKQLKATYAEHCDDAYNPDGIAGLFVEDGVWDGGPGFGRYEGRAKIHAFFSQISDVIVLAAHLSMNPLIEVEGDRATGRWRLLCPTTVVNDDGQQVARWILAQYEEEYERHDGRWMYRTLKVDVNFDAPHVEGWVEGA